MNGSSQTDQGEYLPISGLAVAAACVGVVSAAAVVSPLFLVVPLIGVGLSAMALADVARVEVPKAGRWAALTGLALAVGFGAQAAAQMGVRYASSRARAMAAAEAFLTAVSQGRNEEAIAMCRYDALPDTLLPQPSGPLAGEAAAEVKAKFGLMPTVAAIRACGATKPLIEAARSDDTTWDAWRVRAAIPCGGADSSAPVRLDIAVGRDPTAAATDRWMITGHALR
jgi:hypothetical protein